MRTAHRHAHSLMLYRLNTNRHVTGTSSDTCLWATQALSWWCEASQQCMHNYIALIGCMTQSGMTFQPPWAVLKYLFSPTFAPCVLVNAWAHASLFACLTLWPLFMVAAPYSLNEALVGATFLANGVGSLTGSAVGGFVADRAAKKFAQAPQGRLVYNLAITALFMPLGMLLLGWSLHAHMHIAVLLAGACSVGFGISSLIPGVYSYVSCVDQANAGAATAAVNAAWCMLSGLMVSISVPAVGRLGVGGYLSMLSGVHVVLVALAGVCTFSKCKA